MDFEQKAVKEFHEKYGCVIANKPTMPDLATIFLRSRCMVEEISEFMAAANKGDFVGMADALVDLVYFAKGTGVVMGVDLEPLFNEVQRSNMSKSTEKDAGGKIIKGPNYSPPDLESLVKRQGWNG